MPVTRGALKKLRQDKKRALINLRIKKTVKDAILNFKKAPSKKLLSALNSALDTAAKKKYYHYGKVARLKSRLQKLLSKKIVSAKPKVLATK